MMLRRRPIRARIYQPVTRFGVRSTDWKYIIAISLICYALPMLTKVSVKGIPPGGIAEFFQVSPLERLRGGGRHRQHQDKNGFHRDKKPDRRNS